MTTGPGPHGAAELLWDLADPFVFETVVTAEQIDVLGHTNNVHYLAWLQDCAWAHSCARGVDADTMVELGCAMAVRETRMTYLGATFAGDRLLVGDWITASDGRLRGPTNLPDHSPRGPEHGAARDHRLRLHQHCERPTDAHARSLRARLCGRRETDSLRSRRGPAPASAEESGTGSAPTLTPSMWQADQFPRPAEARPALASCLSSALRERHRGNSSSHVLTASTLTFAGTLFEGPLSSRRGDGAPEA